MTTLAAMERVVSASTAMAYTSTLASQFATGIERLAEIFQCAGGALNCLVTDFSLREDLDDDERLVADLLIAWREVGEVGVIFATRMLHVSEALRKAAFKVDIEREQRLEEAEKLRKALVEAVSGIDQAAAAAAPQRRSWLRWRQPKQVDTSGEEEKWKDQRDTVAVCLEHVAEQMEAARGKSREVLSQCVIDARTHAREVGIKVIELRSSWRGAGGARAATSSSAPHSDTAPIAADGNAGVRVESSDDDRRLRWTELDRDDAQLAEATGTRKVAMPQRQAHRGVAASSNQEMHGTERQAHDLLDRSQNDDDDDVSDSSCASSSFSEVARTFSAGGDSAQDASPNDVVAEIQALAACTAATDLMLEVQQAHEDRLASPEGSEVATVRFDDEQVAVARDCARTYLRATYAAATTTLESSV